MATRTIGLVTDRWCDEIPASHRDLVRCPRVAALTTLTSSGRPQTSVVWCDFDGEYVRVNTMRGFAKERNMRRDPRVTLLCYDPRRPSRYLEVRGRAGTRATAGTTARSARRSSEAARHGCSSGSGRLGSPSTRSTPETDTEEACDEG